MEKKRPYIVCYINIFLSKGKKIYLVIVFRQLLKATYFGKCAKTEIQHLNIVLPDVIENLHKSCKLVYILLYRTRRDITTDPYLNRQYLKKHIRGLNRMNLVYVVFLLDSSSNHLPFYWQWLYKMWYGVDKGWMPTP